MRYFIAILATLGLTATPALAQTCPANGLYPTAEDFIAGDGTAQGDVDLADHDLQNPLAIYQEAPTADLDPDDVLIHAGHAWGQGTQTAADLVLAGGSDEKYFTSTDYANSDQDTLTIIVGNCAAGVCAVAGAVTFTESTDWDCDVTSDIVCACALYDALIAAPVTGVTAERADGTCSDAKVYIQPASSAYYVLLAAADTGGGGVWGTATSGTDGTVIAHSVTMSGTNLTVADGTVINEASGTRLTFIADNQLQVCNAAGTQCFTLGANAADTMTLWDGAGTGAGVLALVSGADIQFGTATEVIDGLSLQLRLQAGNGVRIIQSADNGEDLEALLDIYSASTNDSMAGGAGKTQYGYRMRHDVEQTSTASYRAHDMAITADSQGSAQDYLAFWDFGIGGAPDGNPEFAIQDDGDMLLRVGPGSDTAPLDAKIVAASAYAIATGASRNGADLNEAAGIRTLQIVCSDRTLTDTDLIVFAVDGVDHTLTESTDFDCHGTGSEEICCDNLGAALTTAAIGLTPDCATTAGTCYVTPDEDLLSADINYFDGGANSVGWTLTEGATGSINFYGNVNVYDDEGLGAYWHRTHTPANKTQPAAAGPTATFLNTATFVYLLDANTEYLYIAEDIGDDWDGVSDIVVVAHVALAGAEAANDNIQAEVVAEYHGEHDDLDTGFKTQTRDLDHDIVSDNGQGDVHHLVFIIDHDLGGNLVDAGDMMHLRFRLDAVGGGTDVAAVWYMGLDVMYRTSKPQPETNGTFPTEG